jgi:Uma2 family endonuclease
MPPVTSSLRPFEPGTTGWTAADLDDPEIEALWSRGSYEIIEGVLTTMPPAYFLGGRATQKLIRTVEDYLQQSGIDADFASEVEIAITPARLPRADAALLTREDQNRQIAAAKAAGRTDPDRTRLLVPPTLIIESVSPGHEAHDRRTKKSWYAEFGVVNYWILDAFARTLECHHLAAGSYRLDVQGRGEETVNPSAFTGLSIPLRQLWGRSKSG